ncbi:MAG TPA: cysteine desulfurase [Chitinophagaceae bacterium]|nr:cysteine desulfurase [Chitinophagaceae bacterium]
METVAGSGIYALDTGRIRDDFPILHTLVHGKPLVYLDNGATSQKPLQVIRSIEDYYRQINSNVHRGVHHLSQQATDAFEAARTKVAEFIGARHTHEVIFTRGTTESINLVASSFGRENLKEGDEVLITAMEHHSNIVPWQMLCEEKGARLQVIPISQIGELELTEFHRMLNSRVKILALTHVSNTLGTINPLKEIIDSAHRHRIPVLVDAAQSVLHLHPDVQELDCEFMAFSGHKVCGPTGIGVLYGKQDFLNAMPPWQGGGEMIKTVTFEKTTYNELPFKFEAGTPDIAGAIGLRAALEYLQVTGTDKIFHYERQLLEYATGKLQQIEGLRIYGSAAQKASVISFNIEGLHPYDVGVILDQSGIAVRTGHHCTQPLMDFYGIPGTVRASLAFYNNFEDIDTLCNAVRNAIRMLR